MRERRTISIQMRTTPKIKRWIKESNISPTKVFDEAIKTLMEYDINKMKTNPIN